MLGSLISQRNLIFQNSIICRTSTFHNVTFVVIATGTLLTFVVIATGTLLTFVVIATGTLLMFDHLRILFDDFFFFSFIVICYDL